MQIHAHSVLLFLISLTSLAKGDVFTAQQTEDLVNFVESLRQCRGIVGLTVAVAKGNETWTRGFGMADRERGRNVSTSDLFGIGSLTKAFTSALISLFINETGRYSWQTPVVDILGEDFEFVNEELTSRLTLKDMLTHRTGLGTTNTPFFAGSRMTRTELARRIKYLPVKKRFRDEFEYNNWMYGLAGRVTEVLGGASWEDLLHTHLLQPLNMTSTAVLGQTVTVRAENFAKPYVLLGEEAVPSDPAIYSIRPQEAAGAIASSADDMAHWLLLHINKGRTAKGKQVLNDTRMREMTTAHVTLPRDFRIYSDLWRSQFPVTFASEGYGYGWMTATYRGNLVTWHSGSIYAYTSYIAFLPQIDAGVFVSTNGPGGGSNDSHVVRQLFFYVADLLLEEDPWLNVTNACQFPQLWLNKSSEAPSSNYTVYDDPDFPKPDRYAGRYENPLFGEVEVLRNGSQGLGIQYGFLEGRLYRGEEDNVAMWEVQGSMAFAFRIGNKTWFLQLNFTRPSQHSGFREVRLSDLEAKETLVFHREVPLTAGGRGEGAAPGFRDVVSMVVWVCLSLCVFTGR